MFASTENDCVDIGLAEPRFHLVTENKITTN